MHYDDVREEVEREEEMRKRLNKIFGVEGIHVDTDEVHSEEKHVNFSLWNLKNLLGQKTYDDLTVCCEADTTIGKAIKEIHISELQGVWESDLIVVELNLIRGRVTVKKRGE